MENDEMIEGVDELVTPSYLVVALVVNGSRKTKYIVKWALDKFAYEGTVLFKLFFIRPKISRVPTPMGTVPISQVREDIRIAYKKEIECQIYEKLLIFKNMCSRRKVEAEIVQFEPDDIVDAIKQEIIKHNINKLVIGVSPNSMFSRGRKLSSRISENIPSFCTVYDISKGKLSSFCASDSMSNGSFDLSFQTEWTDQGSATSYSQFFSNPLSMQGFEALSFVNNTLHKKTGSINTPRNKLTFEEITETSLHYQKFTYEEIMAACCSFSEHLKIGTGGNGTVYKACFNHTVSAVKVLHSQDIHRTRQFQQELELLSRTRHPHLVILIGACIDHGCLVYEYMENASLEDRLFCKNDTPPIAWYDRFRIAWEVASALIFLHNTKPKSIIHRDLKPANILLDHNLMSKIGDVGMSTMIQWDPSSAFTIYQYMSLAGTLCYIDPEYQRTGLVSPKSDVYALGIVILQLLTARPAIAIIELVESALEDDMLDTVLDRGAGEWPINETKELAVLALSCAELRRRDRPDLKDVVLPVLERLKAIADEAQRTISMARTIPPNDFICPLVKDVMVDPCVAADGYTYDRRAIEKWFEESGCSPTTNLPLTDRNLTPNHTLLSAIMEWKLRTQ
ncbi:U-box domain-containing protein 35-like [Rutidosis leptorrhynchoides]|uniref:U-box domain-containing protein 35-like n=1 Tax=Rutidosis leptorrhynchoides TaxID=125765 RepID=UPI003A99FBB9